ncbi:MAG TPA: hypothetical protein VFM63_08535 [Pyrinomonadaceae bacterium]|nr:hypothetical protein [Pyrinomonadaceae bacterium]
MTFTIDGETFTFTLEVNQLNQLTSFTATKGGDPYVCSIYCQPDFDSLEAECCTPNGCTQGGCGSS